MPQEIRVGLIGAGAVAQIGHLPAYAALPDARVVALCDSDPDKVKRVADKFSVPRVFDDFQSFVTCDEIDMVDICLPNHLHAPVAIAALRAGRHVLCEMPFGRNEEEAASMVAAAAEPGRTLMSGYSHRFRRDTQALRSQIRSRALGQVYRVKTGWLRRRADHGETLWRENRLVSGGGVLLDLGLQLLDLALYLLGMPAVASVTASTYPPDRGSNAVERSVTALLLLADGTAIDLEAGWSRIQQPDVLYLHAFSTHGAAQMNPLKIIRDVRGEAHDITPRVNLRRHLFTQAFVEEIRHMLACVRGEASCIAPGEDAVKIHRILRAIYESAAKKREVRLD